MDTDRIETETTEKRGRGQPTAYKPEFCETVIALGKEGCWLAEMAAALDVSRPTLDNWAETHDDFFDALTRAKAHAIAWLERTGRKALDQKVFQSRPWEVLLKGREPSYRERQEITGAGGAAIQITLTSDDMDL